MKTLQKITLVAFAVLSAGVANAQSNPCVTCAPPARPTPPALVDPGCLTCGSAANAYWSVAQAAAARTATDNFSNVYQNGHLQYACVDQAGPGNTAQLSQNSNNDAADYGNNAWQTQVNDGGAGGRNSAYGEQLGDRSTIVQSQTGSGNIARAKQADEDFYVSYQEQHGQGNHAYSDQDVSFNEYSMQMQTGGGGGGAGLNNYSTVTQRSDHAWSATVQEGQNNSVAVYQH